MNMPGYLQAPERLIQPRVDVEMEQFHQFGENVCGVFFKWLKDRKAAQARVHPLCPHPNLPVHGGQRGNGRRKGRH